MPRKPRKSAETILPYEELKTAAGGSGSGGGRRGGTGGGTGGGGYRAGQNMVCKILKQATGGYDVVVLKDNLNGFMPTQASLKIGEEVLVQFVCMHNSRALLSARFNNSRETS